MTEPLSDVSASASRRMQLLPESATTTTPLLRQHRPDGLLNMQASAKPSAAPHSPVPASVPTDSMLGLMERILLLSLSAISTVPSGSTQPESGELSWHYTHSGFGAEPEEERQARFCDGDFWDD